MFLTQNLKLVINIGILNLNAKKKMKKKKKRKEKSVKLYASQLDLLKSIKI